MDQTLIWIIVAIVVLLAIIVVLSVVFRKRDKKINRVKAQEMREAAHARDDQLKREEAKAHEADAAARKARAEADEKSARAQRLEMDAKDSGHTAQNLRQEQDEHLRHADRIDPDINTNRHGERVSGAPAPGASGAGAGGVGAAGAGGAAGTADHRGDPASPTGGSYEGQPQAHQPVQGQPYADQAPPQDQSHAGQPPQGQQGQPYADQVPPQGQQAPRAPMDEASGDRLEGCNNPVQDGRPDGGSSARPQDVDPGVPPHDPNQPPQR